VFRGAQISIVTVIPGDMNGDARVNFIDLTPFVLALTNSSEYDTLFPALMGTRDARCDTSGDGLCDFRDLSPFVALLTGGAGNDAALVPEPAVWTLWCGLGATLISKGRRTTAGRRPSGQRRTYF
jgi:hypothetical protein